MEKSLQQRASGIKLLLMDCDGVLTDGRLMLLEDGGEQKWFSVRDGLGLTLWRRAGLQSGIISGRSSSALEQRARELEIDYLRQNSRDKVSDFDGILVVAKVEAAEVAYIGDDLNDIPLMRRSALAIAVGDAASETQQAAHYVTQANGGQGAVREAIELILKAQNRWPDVLRGDL
jgi:3-deoxy-D-manno-octulosonate 8-phosphate phosphatase (KDO 8-P phosphatase)